MLRVGLKKRLAGFVFQFLFKFGARNFYPLDFANRQEFQRDRFLGERVHESSCYNPDLVKGDQVDLLAARVKGKTYISMSPYPGLDKPISLQSWSHQLKVESADDERIDQFVSSLRRNQYTYPEVGASCENPQFIDAPAPFVAEAPGADAEPMTGGTTDPSEAPVPPSGSTPPSS